MRKIVHIDCDCFYAAVEMLDQPRLRGIPLAVGGSPRSRGVIATCNYEARAFGVRSAMASAHAQRLCPALRILSPRFDRYKAVSRQIHGILQRYTDCIEPLSLDEAYLDVSDQPHCQGSATRMAEAIRADVRRETGIVVSAGVAPNKFLAKIASEWRKPDGLFVIKPDEVAGFVRTLPVTRLHGVGQVTARRLHALGLETCADLQGADPLMLTRELGSFGTYLQRLSHGEDHRPVQVEYERKSLSVEHTFARDLPTLEACRLTLPGLVAELTRRLAKHQALPVKTAVVKVKFDDFTQTTRECCSDGINAPVFEHLLDDAYQRRRQPVRLIGLGVRFGDAATGNAAGVQLSLPFSQGAAA